MTHALQSGCPSHSLSPFIHSQSVWGTCWGTDVSARWYRSSSKCFQVSFFLLSTLFFLLSSFFFPSFFFLLFLSFYFFIYIFNFCLIPLSSESRINLGLLASLLSSAIIIGYLFYALRIQSNNKRFFTVVGLSVAALLHNFVSSNSGSL